MHLGRAVVTAVATIAARQLSQVLPDSFCTPQCPQCKNAVTSPFDTATLCVPNSTFIVNCGSCQTCIWAYAIENPDLPDMNVLEAGVQGLLDLCLNTTAGEEVIALQSQVSRISDLGNALTSGHTPTTTYSEFTVTTTDGSSTWTITGVITPTSSSSVSTTSCASDSYTASARYNHTSSASTITAAPMAPTVTAAPDESNQDSLNKSWVIGPVVGSILGVATVFIVVYLTRRKYHLEALAVEAARDIKEEDFAGDSSNAGDDICESTHSNSQAESVEMRELENHEVHELPAREPVGSELNTPRGGTMVPIEEWPLPLSPLPAMFAEAELRDERAGNNNSPKHDTYYNP